MSEPSGPAPAASPPNVAPEPNTARPPATTSRQPPVPSARKGYKLTLWVSATSESGLADVHGLIQLDGADPTPFCRLKAVPNPLARALQEAYVAVEQVRAKPPRMAAPSPATMSTQRPPQSAPRPGLPPDGAAAQAASPVAPPTRPKDAAPAAQPTLF
jgi:hypothetical protein